MRSAALLSLLLSASFAKAIEPTAMWRVEGEHTTYTVDYVSSDAIAIQMVKSIGNASVVEFWSIKSKSVQQTLNPNSGEFRPLVLAFSPDGRLMASTRTQKLFIITDVGTGKQVQTISTGEIVRALSFPQTVDFWQRVARMSQDCSMQIHGRLRTLSPVADRCHSHPIAKTYELLLRLTCTTTHLLIKKGNSLACNFEHLFMHHLPMANGS